MPEDREKERVGVTLFKDQHRWCKQEALDNGVNGGFSAVVRTAIDFYQRAKTATAPARDEEGS